MKDEAFLTAINQDQHVLYWVFKDGENQGYPVPEGTTIVTAINGVKDAGQSGVKIIDGKISVDGAATGYEIYDVNGRRVSSSVTTPGVYVVKIATDKGLRTVKIMKR